MPKQKKPISLPKKISIEDHLTHYDSTTLIKVMSEFDGGIGWEVYKSFLKRKQRESEITCLYKVAQPNGVAEAAYASGYAKAMDDVTEGFISELVQLIKGDTPVVEIPRSEE